MVANEYAKAIYELALEENKEQCFKDCFNALLESIKNEDLNKILTSPFIDVNNKKSIVDKAFISLDSTFINFIKVLLDHNRIALLNDIYDGFNKLILEHNDIMKIDVVSAVKLNSIQMINLSKALQMKYSGKKIELENIIDSDLIGGIQVISNGESLDMSLKASLNRLKESL